MMISSFIFVLFFVSSSASSSSDTARISGVCPGAPETDGAEILNNAVFLLENRKSELRIFGVNLHEGEVWISLDTQGGAYGSPCDHRLDGVDPILLSSSEDGLSGVIHLELAPLDDAAYICLSSNQSSSSSPSLAPPNSGFVHQGVGAQLTLKTKAALLLPLWLQICIIIVLLIMSGLFSGLNLGLMALDKTELKIVESCGTDQEKEYSKQIQPVRDRGNFLLCTLLLSNVMVNNTFTILLDQLTGGGGLYAVIGATFGIVICGEIIPQALCSRHGLAVGARTIWITKFFMFITFPLSFPISLLLDKLLGEELGTVYDREKLRELLKVTYGHHDLQNDEMNIIGGALDLSKKCVVDVMTPFEDVFMISYDSVLDFNTMSDIMKRGYSRIPVFEPETQEIRGLLSIKDLAFVDPDDAIPLKTICDFYKHPMAAVNSTTKLSSMLEEFKKGKCHMALVKTDASSAGNEASESKDQRKEKKKGNKTETIVEIPKIGEDEILLNNVDDKRDGTLKSTTSLPKTNGILGIITLEDVIEEIIQSEIMDETDVITDNRKKTRRTIQPKSDFSAFNAPLDSSSSSNSSRLSPQLSLAVFQFLSSNVPPFEQTNVSPTILQRLVKQPQLVVDYTLNATKAVFIYEPGKPADFFTLVLQGTVEVCVGKESLVFETGPFSFFGVDSLNKKLTAAAVDADFSPRLSAKRSGRYVPDFSVKPTSDVQILKVSTADYEAALNASVLERSNSRTRPLSGSAPSETSEAGDVFEADSKSEIKSESEAKPDSEAKRYSESEAEETANSVTPLISPNEESL